MIIHERYQITTELTPVQRSISLCIKAVEKSFQTGKAFQYIAQWPMVRIIIFSLSQWEIEHGINSKEHGLVIQARGIRANVAINDVIIGHCQFTKQKKIAFAQGQGKFTDVRAKSRAGERPHMLDRIDTKTVHVRLFYPVCVNLDECINNFGTCLIVIVGIIFQAGHVAILVLRRVIIIRHVAFAMIEIRITQFSRKWLFGVSPAAKIEALIIDVVIRHITWIEPVVAGMIDYHVKNNTDRKGLAVFLIIMCRLDKIDQILFGTKVRIDIEIVIDIIAMVGAIVIAKVDGAGRA